MGRWDSDSESRPVSDTVDDHRRASKSTQRKRDLPPTKSKSRSSLPTNTSRDTGRQRPSDSISPRREERDIHGSHQHRRSHHDRNRDNDSTSPPPRKRRRSYRSPDSQSARTRYRSRSRSPAPSHRSRREHDPPRRSRSRSRSRSPPRIRKESSSHTHRRKRSHSPRRIKQESFPHDHKPKRSTAPLPSQSSAFQGSSNTTARDKPPEEKQAPNYAPSGLLAAETNTVGTTGIVLKHNEPPDARLPSAASAPWRLFIFKGQDLLEELKLYERTSWLVGRERQVADILTEHPSCSKQHAVMQFRYTEKVVGEYGDKRGKVRLYVIDLESANGTSLNGERIEGRRYVEVKSGDVVKFGESAREYVALLPPKE